MDFGISALVGEIDREPDGQLLGTPAYVAPERVSGCQAGTASDVYALGLLLYRCLAGASPWEAETVTQMLVAHRYVEPSPLPTHIPMPAELRELCEQCLAKSPEDRPTSAAAATVLAELAGISLPATDVHPVRVELDESATMSFAPTSLKWWKPSPSFVAVRGGRSQKWRSAAWCCAAVGVVFASGISSGSESVPVGSLFATVPPPPADGCPAPCDPPTVTAVTTPVPHPKHRQPSRQRRTGHRSPRSRSNCTQAETWQNILKRI